MANLQTRVINILKTPVTEWPVIAGEHTDVGTLYTGYVMILSAIPVIAMFIGWTMVGYSFGILGSYRMPIGSAIAPMVVQYVLGLIGVYVAAMVVEMLAPKFKSSGSRLDALKLVAYASTPAWVAGVFHIFPSLAMLAILGGLYGIYLFYLGVTPLMKTPQDQVIPYMAVCAVVVIVIFVCIMFITRQMTPGMYDGLRTL